MCFETRLIFSLMLYSLLGLAGVHSQPETIKCLILLTDFSDAPNEYDKEELDKKLNQPGYTGNLDINMVDYWMEVSRGRVFVQNDIVGPYRAEQTASWYNQRSYREGIESAEQGFEWFAQNNPDYDWDGLSLTEDGRFRCLTVIPSVRVPVSGAAHYMGGFTAPNGVRSQRLVGIGVGSSSIFGILHEYGHMTFNWPDLYTRNGSQGAGYLELMSGGGSSPGVPNAALLAQYGWITIKDVTGPQDFTLQENGHIAVRYRNPNNPEEYFMIEARNDKALTTRTAPLDRGLVIWHIDDEGTGNYSINASQMSESHHLHFSLEQADGEYDLEFNRNRGDVDDIWVEGDTFNDNTTPDANWWNGSNSGFGISNITFEDNDYTSFRVTAPGDPVVTQTVDAILVSSLNRQGSRLYYTVAGNPTGEKIPVMISLFTPDGKKISEIINESLVPGRYPLSLEHLKGSTSGVVLLRMLAGSATHSLKLVVDGL